MRAHGQPLMCSKTARAKLPYAVQGQTALLLVVVDDEDGLTVVRLELRPDLRLRGSRVDRPSRMSRPVLVDCNRLLVRDDVPHRGHLGCVYETVRGVANRVAECVNDNAQPGGVADVGSSPAGKGPFR